MDAKARRKVIADMLARLQQDMDMAIDQMPEDWDGDGAGLVLGITAHYPRTPAPRQSREDNKRGAVRRCGLSGVMGETATQPRGHADRFRTGIDSCMIGRWSQSGNAHPVLRRMRP